MSAQVDSPPMTVERFRVLHQEARQRTDCWQYVDGIWTSLQGHLPGWPTQIEANALGSGITPAQLLEAQRANQTLLEQAAAKLIEIRDAPESQLAGLLMPKELAPPTHEATASMILAEMEAKGLSFEVHGRDDLVVRPAAKLDVRDRQVLVDFKAEIMNETRRRSDVWLVV